MASAPVIVWFRDSLRLADNAALSAAAATGAPVICLYVLDEESPALAPPRHRPLGGALRWWLAQSLKALATSLAPYGQVLVLRRGDSALAIANIARASGACAVYWPRIATQPQIALADSVTSALASIGVETKECAGDLLVEPERIRNAQGAGIRVFTPFWKRVVALGAPPSPLPAPKAIRAGPALANDDLASWQLEPRHPDWAEGLRETWTPGEKGAQQRLDRFIANGLKGYATLRDRPDKPNTSRLSPHFRFGEISPRQVWHAVSFALEAGHATITDANKFLAELGWREFSRHLLFDHPALSVENLQRSFDSFPWRDDPDALEKWQRGQTGYPIVDAGMRELWRTGTMHNRVRMVAASFLIKHLLIDWRQGERWFWDTLVDADPASNPASWQWVAGSGADAAPYFRIFNPVLQGEKFDPEGTYVRRWVPEIAGLPNAVIHKPWTAKPLTLEDAGVTLGKTYPAPIVDHKVARERALAAFAKTKRR